MVWVVMTQHYHNIRSGISSQGPPCWESERCNTQSLRGPSGAAVLLANCLWPSLWVWGSLLWMSSGGIMRAAVAVPILKYNWGSTWQRLQGLRRLRIKGGRSFGTPVKTQRPAPAEPGARRAAGEPNKRGPPWRICLRRPLSCEGSERLAQRALSHKNPHPHGICALWDKRRLFQEQKWRAAFMDGCIHCLRCDLTPLSTDTTALLSYRTGTTVRKDTDLGELKLAETHSLPQPTANRSEAVGRATAAERYRTAGSRKDQRSLVDLWIR